MRKRIYLVATVAAIGGLLTGCGTSETQTVVMTPTPEATLVEPTVEVTPTAEVEQTVEVPPTEEVEPETAGCSWNVYLSQWIMDYLDANNIINELFHPDSPFNYTGWDDLTFRDLIDQAMLEGDVEARLALWQQAENILINEHVAVLPVLHYARWLLVRDGIDYEIAPLGGIYFAQWALPAGRDTLRAQAGELTSLDAYQDWTPAWRSMPNTLTEALYRYDSQGRIQPAGARSYEMSDDGTVFTIYLREDATWSDGQPVLAQHYADGIIRLLDPATAPGWAYLMYYISGAVDFGSGENQDPSSVGVSAVDDYTLQITLNSPQAFFDSLLPWVWPVRLDLVEAYGDQWAEPGNFVGNGAYHVIEWDPGVRLIVEANPAYHSAADVSIQRIEFIVVPSGVEAFERGELDVVFHMSGGSELDVRERFPEHVATDPNPGTVSLGLNFGLAPTDNVNLRRTLSRAIDRRTFLDDVLEVPFVPEACGVIPPEVPGHQGCGNVGFEYDPDAALAYLEAAMAELGVEEPGEISLQLWIMDIHQDFGLGIEEMWETGLGINVDVVIINWADYFDRIEECEN